MPLSIKLIAVGFLLLVFGLVLVQKDLRLKFGGRTVDGEVMDDYAKGPSDSLGLRDGTGLKKLIPVERHSEGYISITYRFKDETGTMVIGGGRLPLDTGPLTTVKVVYLPGQSDLNKLVDEPSSRQYWMLYAGLALIASGFLVLKLESYFEVAHRIKKKSAPMREMPVEPPAPKKQDTPKVLDFD